VLQVQREPRFIEEHRDELRVAREVGKDALDRDGLAKALDRLGDPTKHLRLPTAT
jgi:hypothetical protein